MDRASKWTVVSIGLLLIVEQVLGSWFFLAPSGGGIATGLVLAVSPILVSSRYVLISGLTRAVAVLIFALMSLGVVMLVVSGVPEWMPWFVKLSYLASFGGLFLLFLPAKVGVSAVRVICMVTIVGALVTAWFVLDMAREDRPLREAGWKDIMR